MASGMDDSSSLPAPTNSCLPQFPPRVASLALSLFYTALLVFSALGNILALWLTCQKGKKINSTGVYLVHLAVSDLLFTLALPGKITYYVLGFHWPFGDGLCRLTAFMMYLNTYGGIYLMTCVSVDRYLAVVRSPQCPRLRSAGRARLVCVVVWFLALLQTAPLLLTPMAKSVEGRLTCMEYVSVQGVLGLPVLLLVACVISFCSPVGVILFCYVRIAWKLCRAARENPLSSEKGLPRRAFFLTLAVLAVVAVCFGPYHLNVIQFMVAEVLGLSSCAQQRTFTLALQVSVALMNTNCAIDPVIYFFASTQYRKWLLNIWKLRPSSSSSSSSSSFFSSPLAKASSETPSSNHTRGSVSWAEDEV